MKILHVNFEFPPVVGGGAVEAHLLYRELAKNHEVTVLTSEVKNQPSLEMIDGIRVVRCPVLLPWDKPGHVAIAALLSFPFSVLREIRVNPIFRERFDVLNAWFALPTGVVSWKIAEALQCPHLLTLCGGDVYDPTKWMAPNRNPVSKLLAKLALKKAGSVTAISMDLKNRAQAQFGYKGGIQVIPMGMEPKYAPNPRSAANKGPVRLLSISRLVERKGIQTTLQALANLKEFPFVFHIVGEGPMESKLRALSEKLGLTERIVFEGHVSEEKKQILLQEADIFILCSLHEGQCQGIIEAAQYGLPVITGNIGGQTDMIRNETSGLLVTPNSVFETEKAIRRLLSDEKLRDSLGQGACKAVEQFTVKNTADKYNAAFETLVESSSREKELNPEVQSYSKAGSRPHKSRVNLSAILKSTAVLGIFAYGIHLNVFDLQTLIRAAQTPLIPLILSLGLAVHLVTTTLRWALFLRVKEIKISQPRLIQLTLSANFLSFFLFGSAGADVFKTYYVAKGKKENPVDAAMTVLADRTIGLLGLLMLPAILLIFQPAWLSQRIEMRLIQSFVWALTGFILLTALFLSSSETKTIRRAIKFLEDHLPIGQLLTSALNFCRSGRPILFGALGWSVLGTTINVLSYYFTGKLLGLPLDLEAYALIIPLCNILSYFSFIPFGVGTGQIAFFALFSWTGMSDPKMGVTLCTVFQGVNILFHFLFGAIAYLKLDTKKFTQTNLINSR